MNLLFISDIHGITTNLPKIKERFNELKCDKLVVLGDLYYGGIRASLSKEYDKVYVQKFLESFKDKLICIKGNCDSETDIKESNFKIIDGLEKIKTINNDLYITHGHLYNSSNWNKTNSILIYGHLHVPFITKIETNIYINPGSISLPRSEDGPCYLYYNEEEFIIYDVHDNIIEKIKL